MRSARKGLAVLATVLAVATGVNAAVVLTQGFEEDEGRFAIGVTGWTGAGATTTDGSWGSFDAGSTMASNRSHSGSQSMVVQRGSALPAGLFSAVTTNLFEVSYWLYRETSDSGVIVLLQDGLQNVNLGLFVAQNSGDIRTYNGTGWVSTGSSLAVDTWTRFRMVVDLSVGDFGAYDLYTTVETGSESLLGTATLGAAASPIIDRIRFIPQGLTGNTTYIDDVLVRGQGSNLVYVSWGDQIMVATGDARMDTPDKISRVLAAWGQDYDAGSILWRASSDVIREFYDMYYLPGSYAEAYYSWVDSIMSEFDPLEHTRTETQKNAQRLLLYMTVFDHGAPTNVLYGLNPFPWQDRSTIEHPEYQAVDLLGNYHYGVLEFAVPEARALMIDRITNYVGRFDSDGVYVCTRSHSQPALHADQFGFDPLVVAEYQSRYGINILQDSRFDYQSSSYDRDDPVLEQWRQLRGEYLVEFYRELRAALPGKTIRTGIPRGRYLGPPYGNLYLDWEALVSEQLVDGLIVGVFSGAGLHQRLYVPHASIGYLSSEDDMIAIPSFDEAVTNVYGSLCSGNGVELHTVSGYFPESTNSYWSGSMLSAPGTTGLAILGADEALDAPSGQMTVEAMIFIRDIMDYTAPRILSKYDHGGDNQYRGWEWQILPDGRLSYRVNLALPGTLDAGTDLTVKSPAALPLNQWLHVATVFDRPLGVIRLYINGNLEAETSIPDLPLRTTPQQPLYLGQYGGGAFHMFDGLIDELRISSVARQPVLPAAPYDGTDSNTVALYHFDSTTSDGEVSNDALSSNVVQSAMRVFGGEASEAFSVEGFDRALKVGGVENLPYLNQNFEEDWGSFVAGVVGSTGAGSATAEGLWGSFDAGSTVSTNRSHSDSQSMVAQRGSASPYGIFPAVSTNSFEVSYWLYRETSDSGLVILLQDGLQNVNLGLFVAQNSGDIRTFNGAGWVSTGSSLAVGTWTRIRMVVDLSVGDFGTYELYTTVGAGAESLLGTATLGAAASPSIDRIRFLPQGLTGNTTYIDDILVTPPQN